MILSNRQRAVVENLGNRIGLDLRYFFGSGMWIFIRYALLGIFGIFVTVAFVRLESKEFFGQYQFILNLFAIASVLSLPGLNVVALRDVALGNTGIVRGVTALSFVFSFIAVPFLILYGVHLILIGNVMLGWSIVFGGFLFPFYYALNSWYTFYEGVSLFREATIRVVIGSFVSTVALLIGLYFGISLVGAVTIFLTASILLNGYFTLEVYRKTTATVQSVDLKFGVHCTVQKFIYSFLEIIPVLLIPYLFGFEKLAIYQIGYFLIALSFGFISALSSTYMPLLFRRRRIDFFKIFWKNLSIGLVFFVGLVVFLLVFFRLLYGADYEESYRLALLFSFVVIFLPLRMFLIGYLTSLEKNAQIIATQVLVGIFSISVLFVSRSMGFERSIVSYFYAANLLTVILLVWKCYPLMSRASEKADSMVSEIN